MSIIEEDYYENRINGRFNWYLPQDFMDQYEIPIAPLSVAFDDGETFTENDNVPIERFYNKMAHLKHSQQQVNRLLGNGLRTMRS